MLKLAVLVSGGGTNLQAIIDAIEKKEITNAKIQAVISNNRNVYALERAKRYGIAGQCISPKDFPNRETFYEELLKSLKECKADLVVLAGYLVAIPPCVVEAFPNRIINIHPSLIPLLRGWLLWVESTRRSFAAWSQSDGGHGSFCGCRYGYWADYSTKIGGSFAGGYTRDASAKSDGAGRMGNSAPGD